MDVLWFVLGLAALVAGAELLVRGASRLALSFGISPLVVGLTIVAFGTSAPELAVSVGSALQGNDDVAVGNVVGSNIFNVLFILGASALITPLLVHVQIVRQEVPIMVGATLLLLVQSFDGGVDRVEGALLFGLLVAYTGFLVWQSRREGKEAQDEYAGEMPKAGGWDRHWSVQLLLVGAGLLLLVVGSQWLVQSAVSFAKALGVSDLVIGLTIVSAGTSLPEVATSITAAVRGERDIAIGNVVGSNTFNILGCVGATALVADGGLPIAQTVRDLDLWVATAVAMACIPVFHGRRIGRWQGAVFLFYYAAYVTWLVLAARHSDALPSVRTALVSVAMPLTVVALVVGVLRRRDAAAAPPV